MERKGVVGECFSRANQVIQSDKSVMTDGCQALVLQDLARFLEEYFELSGAPTMKIGFDKGTYRVEIRFEADRVKKFNVLK